MSEQFPEAFLQAMQEQLGEAYPQFYSSLSEPSPHSVLLNPFKGHVDLETSAQVPWNPLGRYLALRPEFVKDPHYHAGAYYSQEASSMLVTAIMERLPSQGPRLCLDLCAAPGGKSLNLLNSLSPQDHLVSNEIIRSRYKVLKENLIKWGKLNVSTSCARPSDWASKELKFDLLLIDAPCSGEGMFRKDPKVAQEWSPSAVSFCADRQKSILRDAINCLASGAYLMYSTCTYNEEENGQVCQWLEEQGLSPVQLELPEDWGFQKIRPNAWQAYPHRVQGEGFFLALFKANGEQEERLQSRTNAKVPTQPIDIDLPLGFELRESENKYSLHHSSWAGHIETAREAGIYMDTGLQMGAMKGKDFIPAHDLAMSEVQVQAQGIALEYNEAIRYLRKETFPLSASHEDGWYLARYERSILGWIKIAAGRMKNHYPKSWMIRKRF